MNVDDGKMIMTTMIFDDEGKLTPLKNCDIDR